MHIVTKNLSHIYNPKSPFEKAAIKDVSLEIEEGEFFGIIGHTGSGKSTFVQHLNGLIRVPSSLKRKKKKGDNTVLSVGEYDLTQKKTDFRALRKRVGMVFQYPENQLFAETVFDDVAFAYKNFVEEKPSAETLEGVVKEALETVGLNFEEVKNSSPFDLSGGQRRRVAIAGVIVAKPEVLVLDEPAAGLDPMGKVEIMGLLHELHQKWCKTVVIVSHDMDEVAENCTRIAVFAEGRLLFCLPPRELFQHTDELLSHGLDLPLTAKLCKILKEKGIDIDCDFTMDDFVKKVLERGRGQ